MRFCYVLFVRTGLEEEIAKALNHELDSSEFVPFNPKKESVFRRNGVDNVNLDLCFPGYVFLESELPPLLFLETRLSALRKTDGFYRVLNYGKMDEIAIHDDELLSLKLLFDNNYILKKSIGIIVGDKVQINSGPLIGIESKIVKINRHKRQAVIELEFMGATRQVVVALEIVQRI